MEEIRHWAERIQTGDRVVATIRHENDGSKNIHNATVIVVKNNEGDTFLIAAFNRKEITIPYNELKPYDPHEASLVKCDICSHEWVATRPAGLTKLECPNCLNMVQFENK